MAAPLRLNSNQPSLSLYNGVRELPK